MPAFKDRTGQRFGRLVVVRLSHIKKWSFWVCLCDCGTEIVVSVCNLGRSTTSCGCAHRDELVARNTKHGHTPRGGKTSLYARWAAMIQRCENPNDKHFPDYGGRGIKVYERGHDFQNFLADILATIGEPPPDTLLDRIDNDRGYEPGNWRWASSSVSAYNRRPKKWYRKPK